MNKVFFIRHGATAGNLEHRYIGRTDEKLCQLGVQQIQALHAPNIEVLFVSPMTRTRQSAELLFPDTTATIVHELRETDFGVFEAKTAEELSDDPDYRAWIDFNCLTPIPGGEAVSDFKARCINAFLTAMGTVADEQRVAFVIHGGCIMSILEALAKPQRSFYDYHIGNGTMLCAEYDGKTLTLL